MGDDTKREIPFTLKLTQVSQVLRIPIGGVRALIRGEELEQLSDANGPLVMTQSIVDYLGRTEFKRRWPSKLGSVKFEEQKERKKRR